MKRLCPEHEKATRILVVGWDDDDQDGGRDCMACLIEKLTRERMRTRKLVVLVKLLLAKVEERATDQSIAAGLGVSEWETFMTEGEAQLYKAYKSLKEE
jgi:hypothetical protein